MRRVTLSWFLSPRPSHEVVASQPVCVCVWFLGLPFSGLNGVGVFGLSMCLRVIRCSSHSVDIQDPGCRILDPASWIQELGSRILDAGSRILDPGSCITDPGSRILDSESWIQDPGSRILDIPGSRITDPGSMILDHKSWIQNPGSSWSRAGPGPARTSYFHGSRSLAWVYKSSVGLQAERGSTRQAPER